MEGLKTKYIVRKAETGEDVDNCFVLRPEKDPAAVSAIRAYAEATDNAVLASDLLRWLWDITGMEFSAAEEDTRPIDANRLSAVLEKNFGHTGGAAVLQQLIDIQPTIVPPSNDPLMLNELHEMDGEPVWISPVKETSKISARWMLVSGYDPEKDRYLFTPSANITQGYDGKSYGKTWLAYSHKPEAEIHGRSDK